MLASVSGSNPTGKAYQIADILLKDKLSASEPEVQKLTSFEVEPVPLTKDELRQFEASYWSYEENYSRKIYLKSDTLRYSRGEQNENRLLPIDRNEFQMLDVTDGLRVNFHLKYGKPYKMIVTVNGNNPSELYAYMPLEAKDQDLKALEGSYYSKELDCTYVLKVRLDGLVLMVNDVEMGHLRPVMDGLFVIEDFGVIKFDEKNKNVFVLDANRVKQIKFSKSKTIG